jgi:hypothetical protein
LQSHLDFTVLSDQERATHDTLSGQIDRNELPGLRLSEQIAVIISALHDRTVLIPWRVIGARFRVTKAAVHSDGHGWDTGMVFLILDGFTEHKTEMIEEACIQCGVFEIVLPPHSSNRIQPLDLCDSYLWPNSNSASAREVKKQKDKKDKTGQAAIPSNSHIPINKETKYRPRFRGSSSPEPSPRF